MPDKLKIEKEMFEFALQNNSYGTENYLDIETGNIISYSEDDIFENELTSEEIESNSKRYLYIEPVESDISFKFMEDFIETIKDKSIHNDLLKAINGQKPFRSFKDRLSIYPAVKEDWYKYYEDKLEDIMMEWLKERNIDAELV
jgi:hypothetical protein